MAIIPRIKVSSGRKREKCQLLTDSSTTANFGFVQPTFAREMMPNSKFEVSVNTRVLNAPMPVPTYGRIELEHRHVFVPYIDVCPQFDSFLSAQSYKPGSGTAYVPSSLPVYATVAVSQYVLGRYADWTIYARNTDTNYPDVSSDDVAQPTYEYSPILMDGTKKDADKLDYIKLIYNTIFHQNLFESPANAYFYGRDLPPSSFGVETLRLMPSGSLIDANQYRGSNDDRTYGNWLLGGWMYVGDNTKSTDAAEFGYQDYDSNPNGLFIGNVSNDFVTLENADFISKFGTVGGNLDFVIAFRLRPSGKRFVSLLKGLGYQFTPNLYNKVDNCNWLKLFAYYKAWFNIYRPKREFSFTNTTCYNLIKLCENSNWNTYLYVQGSSQSVLSLDTCKFIDSLCMACSYYLPQDYFGMSVTQPNANYMGDQEELRYYIDSNLDVASNEYNSSIRINTPSTVPQSTVNIAASGDAVKPAAQLMALKVLKYVNKNTIVGKSIHDYIKVHFGVSLDSSHDLESVYEIGSVKIPVDINIVTSTASTDTDELGAYAARGLGWNQKSNKFVFENKQNFGVWITLTTIIPKSGYYQGILKENMATKRYDFFTPEFDALGYDVLTRDEISADYPTQVSEFNQVTMSSNDFDLKKAFGFVPRYSHYKVGRNIVSGDLSLRGYRNQYGGYYLDRKIPYERYLPYWVTNGSTGEVIQYNRLAAPSFIPSVVFDNFRRIDPNDKLGNYNRMFYSESVLDDHFIINSTFKVDAWLPAKSLSESFDTLTEEDGKVIDVTHS